MKAHKITRICWNSNNWIEPSGAEGKSKDINSFEDSNGFGFEEWIFDFTKIIDGYIYGYIPAAGADRHSFSTITGLFDLSFYTIQNKKRETIRWWIGTIFDVEIISKDQSKKIYNTYKKNGWLKERFNQLKKLKISYENYLDSFPTNFFNIRFKLKNIQLLNEPITFSHKDPAIKSNYYNFLDFKQFPQNVLAIESKDSKFQLQKETFFREAYTLEAKKFNRLHSIIGNQLLQQLQSENIGNYKIFSEFSLKNNTRIDIMLETNSSKHIIYEIKIAHNLREVLRQSLGQLLEYAFHLTYEKIEKLIIVSTFDLSNPKYDEERKFLDFLNTNFNIPILYEHFDIQNT